MELNFNSVEMSSKPNAEVSSFDYAEAPLTFNSVETIPVLNASAAFKTDSGKVFKEDVDIVQYIIINAEDTRINRYETQSALALG